MADQNRIVIVGVGLGGICAGIHLLRAGIEDFVILERESYLGCVDYVVRAQTPTGAGA